MRTSREGARRRGQRARREARLTRGGEARLMAGHVLVRGGRSRGRPRKLRHADRKPLIVPSSLSVTHPGILVRCTVYGFLRGDYENFNDSKEV